MNKINSLEKILIGGIEQWVLIRGSDDSKPVLLFVQAGPGFPIIPEANAMENKLKLENHFVVIYWDQRGCGKSFNKNIPPASINLDQLVFDTNELVDKLKERLGVQKIFIVGFSIGATIAMKAVTLRPENYRLFVAVGIDVKMDEAEMSAYSFALKEANARKKVKAIKELEKIGKPPHTEHKKFQVRVKWVTNFGGVYINETYDSILRTTLKNMFFTREYSLLDIVRTVRGMNFSQKKILSELSSLNMLENEHQIDVPVIFIQGTHDMVAPLKLSEKLFLKIIASGGKQFIRFDNSAHMPHYEESEKFRNVILDAIKN